MDSRVGHKDHQDVLILLGNVALVPPYTLLATTDPTSPSVLHESHMFLLKFSDPFPHKIKK